MKKIKGSVAGIFPDTVFIIFAISALIAVPVRVYQLSTIIDTQSGFFSDKANLTIPLLYAVTAAAAVVIIVLSFLCGHIPECKCPRTPDKGVTITSLLLAAGLLVDFVQTLLSLLSDETYTSVLMTSKGTIPLLLRAIAALLGGIYFIIHGVSYSNRSISYRKLGVLACALPIWYMARLIRIFIRAISFVNVSEVLFELAMIVFFIMFFLILARTVTKVDEAGRLWSMLACGFAGALFALICFVPRFAVKLIGGDLVEGSPVCYADFAAAIFAVYYIVTVFGRRNNPEKQPVPDVDVAVPTPAGPVDASEVTEVRESVERITLEEIRKKERDELAFRIAEQYSDKSLDDLASEYDV